MLSNRTPLDETEDEATTPSIPSPQLLDAYVDIDCWAREYLRGRLKLERVGDNVSTVSTSTPVLFSPATDLLYGDSTATNDYREYIL